MGISNAQQCNLNIWYDLPSEIWDKMTKVYERMPGWMGYTNGLPYWFGHENDLVFITASVEPSGLSFFAQMEMDDWLCWIERFKEEATKMLGFEVGEPEDGFI